jgi:signal transduction histidine kinase
MQPGFFDARIHPDDHGSVKTRWATLRDHGKDVELEFRLKRNGGTWVWVRSIVSGAATGDTVHLQGFMLDVTERHKMELELQQAQKLESVGRLASGVAHEINTPIQFVSDSIHFVRDAVTDLFAVVESLQDLKRSIQAGVPTDEALAAAVAAEEKADLAYLEHNVPKALDRSLEGLDRVATIVRSMKEFAHPDQREMAPTDLNRAIASTLTIARNEYKYVAEVATEFETLPHVTCHLGDVNQAILNMIVNAAHAIGDVVKGTENRGLITIRTRREGDNAIVLITDTGGGIPENVRERIFDPFFTTKEVGKGTGQGLAIARSVIVEKHGGELTFESERGKGTTFTIKLPIQGKARKPMEIAA